MKIVFLCLMAVLFSSCATVGGIYSSSTNLSKESPKYGKAFEMRKAGNTYVMEYDYAFSPETVTDLRRATYGYGRHFASLDAKNLARLCSGDSMPTLRQQDVVLEKILSKNFDAGVHFDYGRAGCREPPVFVLVDDAWYKTPAKAAVISASVAVDAGLIYLFPIAYPIFALGTLAIAAAIIIPGLH